MKLRETRGYISHRRDSVIETLVHMHDDTIPDMLTSSTYISDGNRVPPWFDQERVHSHDSLPHSLCSGQVCRTKRN